MEWGLLLLMMFFGGVLVLLTVWIHYEAMMMISASLKSMDNWCKGRLQVIIVIVGLFAAHTAEIWLFAGAYYLLADVFSYGYLDGALNPNGFFNYLYFSASTYTSLGFGEIYPVGPLRFVAGAEALAGLMMITWSASFTYLVMEKIWKLKK